MTIRARNSPYFFKERKKMKNILTGIILMFTTCSCIQFWLWFIDLERTKQIKLKDYIYKKRRNK